MTTKTVQGRFRLHPMAAACALMMFGLAHAQQADTTSDDAKAKAEAKKKTDAEMTVVTVAGIRRGIEEAISIKKTPAPSSRRFPPRTSASCPITPWPSRSRA